MTTLNDKRILLGISGGIAAYKSAELTRQLKTAGAEVRVVMTRAAAEFITPLTMQALSGNPVHQHMLDPATEAGMGHIELARWADLVLIAPATADLIARLAHGFGDDLLTTLTLATEAPIALAPAMNQAMWRDPRTQDNAKRLSDLGMHLWGPGIGEQACGDTGPGRMLEPDVLAEHAATLFAPRALTGRKVVITAGPTREALDPVRYLSNHSSGKMGYALAQAANQAGAEVVLISGPTGLDAPHGVTRIQVESAEQMLNASLAESASCDIFIAAAAVADYRPAQIQTQKIKKSDDQIQLALIKNPDVVASVTAQPKKPFTVGFAAETQNLLEHARDKLQRKRLDLMIANDVSQPGIGFNSDENAVTVISRESQETLPQASKQALARELIKRIAESFSEQSNTQAPQAT